MDSRYPLASMARTLNHDIRTNPSFDAGSHTMTSISPFLSQTTTIPEQQSESARRRTRSATPTFSTESGPGAFTPLVGLPRRPRQFEKRALFQIAPDDDEEQKNSPSAPAAQPQEQSASDIPFPSSSEAPFESSSPFPSLDPPITPDSRASSISRSGSTPIVLANGKTLVPSLKSSVSSSQITDWRARSRSEPSTHLIPKTVHFPERKDNLENVVLFEKTARPRAVSGNADDTETETEGYDSPVNAAILAGHNAEQQFGLEIDVEQSSTVPVIDPTVFSNVHIETLVFPRTRPPTLRGSILVKNVAFEKSVALRFTLDNWQTTSEVVCRHVCTLPSLPSPFPPERISLGSPQLTWDRFSFMVRLEDIGRKLAERTIFFAARFMAAGVGEWWDNNRGANYKLIFKKAPSSAAPVPAKNPSPLRFTDAPKKMFPGLDLRPSKMSLPPTDSDMPPLRLQKPFSPSSSPPKSALSAPTTSNVNDTVAPPPPMVFTNSGSAHQRSMSIVSSGSSESLRLSNYASPASPVQISGGNSNRHSVRMMLGPVIGGHPISLGPSETSRGDSPVRRRSPNNSFNTPSTINSITSIPSSLGVPFAPAGANRTPSPSAFTNVKANDSTYPFSTADSTYAALVEKWCFHQSPPPRKDTNLSLDMSAPSAGPAPANSPSSLRFTGALKKMPTRSDLRPSTMFLPPSDSDMPPRRLLANNIPEEQVLRRNIGGLGQFQAMPIKPLAPFLTVAYILAQRILSMARSSIIFSTQKVHIARQAMHLVILFNDSLDVGTGLSDEQEEERINLEDELRDFEKILKRLDDLANVKIDGTLMLRKFHKQIFRQRPYFESARDVETDVIYPKFEAYDLRTLEIMQSQTANNYLTASSPEVTVGDSGVSSSSFGSLGLPKPTSRASTSMTSPSLEDHNTDDDADGGSLPSENPRIRTPVSLLAFPQNAPTTTRSSVTTTPDLHQLEQQLRFRTEDHVDLKLSAENRKLVYKGSLDWRGGAGDNEEVEVFLFDHAILMVKQEAKADQHTVFRRPIPLELLHVSGAEGHGEGTSVLIQSKHDLSSHLGLSSTGSHHTGHSTPISLTSASRSLVAGENNGFPITFTDLGWRRDSTTLWADTLISKKMWLENIQKQQELMKESSKVFETALFLEGGFTPGGVRTEASSTLAGEKEGRSHDARDKDNHGHGKPAPLAKLPGPPISQSSK